MAWQWCVQGHQWLEPSPESQGSSLWGKGQDRVRVRVGIGHLCRDKENIRQSWARLFQQCRQVRTHGEEVSTFRG